MRTNAVNTLEAEACQVDRCEAVVAQVLLKFFNRNFVDVYAVQFVNLKYLWDILLRRPCIF